MLAICTPIILCLLLLISITLLLFRKWLPSLLVLFIALSLNCLTETFAFNLSADRNEQGHTLTILTFNMHSQGKYMDLNRDNPDEMLSLLRIQNADIILFLYREGYYGDKGGKAEASSQAVTADQNSGDSVRCRALRDSILVSHPFSHYTSKVMTYGQNAIFSKFRIEPLHQNPEYNLINSYKVVCEGDSFAIINCHLQSNNIGEKIILGGGTPSWFDKMGTYVESIGKSAKSRKRESEFIRSIADSCSCALLPIVVAGDMNDVGGSATVRSIEGEGERKLRDVWWQTGNGMGFTYHDYNWLYFRLDHIFCSSHFEVLDSKVIDQSFSDHEILITKLKFK